MTTFISRRELLRRAGIAGAVAMVPADSIIGRTIDASPAVQAPPAAAQVPLETLSPSEAGVLDAIVARIIPSDANGIGAREAGAVRYIDRALGGALAPARNTYRDGLAALDQYARISRGKPFTDLGAEEQDAVLVDVESGRATGFPQGSAPFFALVRNHTIQGTFCDPFYGGNTNFLGWDLIGYPGVRTIVAADEQRLGADVPHTHKSAYESGMFNKATADATPEAQHHHGDKA